MKQKYTLVKLFFASSLLFIAACSGSGGGSTETGTEHLAAGDATVLSDKPSAFEEHSANMLDVARIKSFNLGNDFFQNPWVEHKASTQSRDGLGPFFNNNACQDCHIRDGRGHAANVNFGEIGHDFSSLLIRSSKSVVSVEDMDDILASLIANVPDSSVGGQLQHNANSGIPKEVELGLEYTKEIIRFEDGTRVELRKPIWHMTSLYEGYDFDSDTVFSARVAAPMIGLGMLELLRETTILEYEDKDDANKDGISGKANYVWDVEAGKVRLGRFGWKAGQPSVRQQAAGAFLGDMGLTNEIFPEENCLSHQTECLDAENGNGDQTGTYNYEVASTILNNVVFYSQNLGVPVRRNAYSSQVKKGKALFMEANCQACHRESYQTPASSIMREQSSQTIYPYTDMLLHDMGEDLADFTVNNEVPQNASEVLVEFLASATEWRTPPLWGLGMTKRVDPEASFLHDGRARTIMEAVLWHGGEAEKAKLHVLKFNEQQQADFLAFLNDL